jgi:16S rRNA (cytosine967-C5)-methyltransferase
VRPAAGDLVLDACAAPGGKTTAIAAARGDAGAIVAVDLRPKRVRLLQRTVRRSGSRSIHLVRADVTAALPLGPRVDWALLDAPCSGLGTIRRDPEIRWRRRESELPRLAATQLRMLERVADVVRPGGSLVYATCSSEPEENEQVVDRFLARDDRFELIDPCRDAGELAPFVVADRYFRTSPAVHALEAFFGAILRRRREGPGTARTL